MVQRIDTLARFVGLPQRTKAAAEEARQEVLRTFREKNPNSQAFPALVMRVETDPDGVRRTRIYPSFAIYNGPELEANAREGAKLIQGVGGDSRDVRETYNEGRRPEMIFGLPEPK